MADNSKNNNDITASTVNALSLLSAIEAEGSQTQRTLSDRIGIALGLTNALLKRALHKGLIKIQDAPPRRYAYFLTPQGFSEKSRLVGDYLNSSLNFFRLARKQYEDLFCYCDNRGWHRVLLIGAGELAEISLLASYSYNIKLVGIVDDEITTLKFSGLDVFNNIDKAGEVDAIIITDAQMPQSTYDWLVGSIPDDRVLAPAVLHLSRINGSN